MTVPLIAALNISKSFGSHQVLRSVSFEVAQGEALCILGPSGSGKSTLLRCLNMLERPDEGAVFLGGDLMGYRMHGNGIRELHDKTEARQRQRLGMVFQQFNLFPHMTVLENLTEGPVQVQKRARSIAKAEALALLDRVGLAEKARSFPAQLSGGQQQRVAIARALAMRPEALLFDEPTSALDPEMVNEVLQVIRELVRDGMTSIIVTHEVGFAREVCDRFLFMEDGLLVEDGPASALNQDAAHARTRAFLAKVL
ncbi:amino acid ABC transporter ATP-binding protein [Microbacterium sp. NPDC055910]|uniref:amino acid ABC transporter ATP-binding protein n=1 Tax=Microbacterium sp. NPDC055910 TaxID=3345659 RepID=UPI0035E12ADD